MTIAPRNNSIVSDIPRSSPSIVPPSGTPTPTIRNYTTAYTTGMSSAYIGLYTIISLMGAEGITIGVLFGVGLLVIKKRLEASRKKDEKMLKASATELDVNSSTSSLLDSLKLNGSQPIVILRMDWSK